MQITLNFGKAMNKDMALFWEIHKLFSRYGSSVYLIGGNMGLNVENISWENAYEIADIAIQVIRKKGVEAVDGIRLVIQDDVETSSLEKLERKIIERNSKK